MDPILFFIFAAVAVICAISLIVQKHPIKSALSLIGVMGSLAILYLLLGAEFIAAAQLIVYAGAIMVLFVFVIMLLNAGEEKSPARPSWFAKLLGIPLMIALLGILSYVIQRAAPEGSLAFGEYTGGAREVGRALFTTYLLPFEITSVLILIAILGAVVLAKKEL
ncbi:MAG: NADH-quinone oxidoreductase subunit J [Acidimicrobiia bacterium]|nr:NADH-quinone oxidoreductase subunit J [Acidimicrobiia bacterium]